MALDQLEIEFWVEYSRPKKLENRLTGSKVAKLNNVYLHKIIWMFVR